MKHCVKRVTAIELVKLFAACAGMARMVNRSK